MRTIDLKIGDVGITHGPVAGADLPTIATEQRNASNIFWTAKMVRKLVDGEESSDQKEVKVDAAALNQNTSLSVHIQVDGSHVRISNDKRIILDDYEHNFSGGRIGIRTESQFVVRNK